MCDGYTYTACGLTLRSNRALPDLMPADADAPIDVQVDLMIEEEPRPPSAEVEKLLSGAQVLSKPDGTYFHLWFRGDGQLDFEIDAKGTRISATWTLSVIEEVTALLLGQVLGCVLRLRGILCLHACAIKIGEHAAVIVGHSGIGKSTLAAALAKQGYAILSDDIAVLDDCGDRRWLALPGYPRLRLWPETIQALYGPEDHLARIFSFTKKRFVSLSDDSTRETAWRFQSQPLPLGALYVLGERKAGLTAPIIEPMPPTTAVMALMAHRALNHLYLQLNPDKQAHEFAGLSRVAMEVPTRHVICNDGLDALPRLCEAIVEDLSTLTF